ncbi:UNVERIFIED_CONTAM: NAD(P)-dependent dehydrogenase (short-subunit alcohol dehydrogenase family) [Streptomyces canus]
MTGRLTGRTAVVTGGSTGIGQEIARRLAAEGADIAVADIDPADETRDLVTQTGQRFLSDRVDVSDEDAINGFAARVRRELGVADTQRLLLAAPVADPAEQRRRREARQRL